jgi:hypothetical protein
MNVIVRPYQNGGWEVDIEFRRPDAKRYRERCTAVEPRSREASAATRSRTEEEGGRRYRRVGVGAISTSNDGRSAFATRIGEAS